MESWQFILTAIVIWFLVNLTLGHLSRLRKMKLEKAQVRLETRQLEFDQRTLFIKH